MAIGHWAKQVIGPQADGPSIAELDGVNINNPTNGQAIIYDAAAGEWKNGAGGGGGGGSFDPTITNPQDGQAVVYDGTANKWKNGAVDVGWSVGEQQLFSETVTTVSAQGNIRAPFVYATPINYSAITVVFENHEYTCPKIVMDETQVAYGGVGPQGPDFSEYPFAILSSLSGDGNMLFTETAGTYTVAVIANGITVTDDFKEAVKTASGSGVTIVHMDDGTGELDKTAQELFTAARSGVVMLDGGIDGIFAFSMLLSASDEEGDTPGTTVYSFTFAGASNGGYGLEFVADSLNGYPVISGGGES